MAVTRVSGEVRALKPCAGCATRAARPESDISHPGLSTTNSPLQRAETWIASAGTCIWHCSI
eukprot:11656035-Heterocapsa_arctica.AAC.1